MHTLRLITLTLSLFLLASIGGAEAKCKASWRGGASANKLHSVKLTGSSFVFTTRGSDGKRPIQTWKGKLRVPGHHVKSWVPDSGGYFVTFDCYAGIAIYRRDGKLVKQLLVRTLLTKGEAVGRPGKWACHPGGRWNKGGLTFSKKGKSLTVTIHSGRQVQVMLASGKIVPPKKK